MLFILFAFLFALLLISNLVITYSNLFRNRETSFLHSLPMDPNTIFQWKFLESTVVASWAFLFLIAPMLAAYGLVEGVAWSFYPMTLFDDPDVCDSSGLLERGRRLGWRATWIVGNFNTACWRSGF